MLRKIVASDFNAIVRIYEKFYKDEFTFPDFVTNFISAFVLTDENNEIVSVVGLRTILEAVIMTDKDKSNNVRYEALKEGLLAVKLVSKSYNYDQIHAFVKDKVWAFRLKKEGFVDVIGEPLVLIVSEEVK